MKRKEASYESFLHVGWHVAVHSLGKQKLRESETSKTILKRTFPAQSNKDLES